MMSQYLSPFLPQHRPPLVTAAPLCLCGSVCLPLAHFIATDCVHADAAQIVSLSGLVLNAQV